LDDHPAASLQFGGELLGRHPAQCLLRGSAAWAW
jgi:hypothetical protein